MWLGKMTMSNVFVLSTYDECPQHKIFKKIIFKISFVYELSLSFLKTIIGATKSKIWKIVKQKTEIDLELPFTKTSQQVAFFMGNTIKLNWLHEIFNIQRHY